jgi:diguanylate cyclase (GGDEF)-like protein
LLDECAAHGEPMALCFLDLDHFKAINDTHGHDVGDRVLQGVARVILSRQHGHDLSARIGGEEFILVWPGLTRLAAQRRAQALLAEIAALSEPELRISASIGLSLRDEGESLPELMRRADMALLRAKRNGRARVELAESDEPSARQARA